MIRLKILLPLFIILLAYSVTCEDLREVKRFGWLRARQLYQFNHPPIVENDDIILPVIYDKVIDRADRLQKNLRTGSSENSEAKTVSILEDEDFRIDTTTELLDTESTTEYYGVNQSKYITEIPEDFSTTPKYKRRRFKLAKYTYSYQPKTTPVSVVYDNEQSYAVSNRFSERRQYHRRPSYQLNYKSKTGTNSESEISDIEPSVPYRKSTELESKANEGDSIPTTSIKRRPGLRRLRKNKKKQNFGYQDQLQISDIEQTKTERNNVNFDDKQVIVDQSSTLLSYDAEISSASLDTDTETENTQSKTNYQEEMYGNSSTANIKTTNSETETNYHKNKLKSSTQNRASTVAQSNKITETSLLPRNKESEGTQNKTDDFEVADNFDTVQVSKIQALEMNTKSAEINYENESGSAVKSQVRTLKYFNRPPLFATRSNYASDTSFSSTNSDTESIHSKTDELVVTDNLNIIQASVQDPNKIIIFATGNNNESESITKNKTSTFKYLRRPQMFTTRRNYASGTSLVSSNREIESTRDKINESEVAGAVQISNEQSSNKNIESATDGNYEGTSDSSIKNQVSTLKYLKRPPTVDNRRNFESTTLLISQSAETDSIQSKTAELAVADKLNILGNSNIEATNKKIESIADNNYRDTSRSSVGNQVNTVKYLIKRPLNFISPRNYTSITSISSKNLKTENTKGKTDESVVKGELNNAEISYMQDYNATTKFAADSNNKSMSIKNRVTNINKFKRPQTFANRRNNATISSLLSKSTQNKTEEIVVANKINSVRISNKNTELATDINNEGDFRSEVTNQENTLKYLKRPQAFATRRNYASEDSAIKPLKLETESTQIEIDDIAIENREKDSEKSSINISKNVANVTAEINKTNESVFTKNSRQSFKRPQNFASRRYSGANASLESYNTGFKRVQSGLGSTQIEKSSLTNIGISEKDTENGKSDITVTSLVSRRKHLKRPINFTRQRISAAITSVSSSSIDTENSRSEKTNFKNSVNQVGKVDQLQYANYNKSISLLADSSNKEKSNLNMDVSKKQNNFLISQYQNSGGSVTSTNLEREPVLTQINEKSAKDKNSMILENVVLASEKNKITKSAVTTIEEILNIKPNQYEIEKTITAGKITNVNTTANSENSYNEGTDIAVTEKVTSVMTSTVKSQQMGEITKFEAENNYNKESKFVFENEDSVKQQDFASKQNVNSHATFTINQKGTTLTKTQAQMNDSAFTNTGIITSKTLYTNFGKTIANNSNLVAEKEKSANEKEYFLMESKSTVTGKLRSSVNQREQKSYQNSKITNNLESKGQNIEIPEREPTKRFFEKSLVKSSIDTSEEKYESDKNFDQLSQVTKLMSADKSSQTIDASKMLTEDIVVKNSNIQIQPASKQITKTMFITAARFKVNEDVLEKTSDIKNQTDFSETQQKSTKVSTLTADSADSADAKMTIEKFTSNQFSRIPSVQQQQFDRQQYFESKGSIHNSRISEALLSSETEDNAGIRSYSTATTIKGNKKSLGIPTNRIKNVEASYRKPVETEGIETVTKQFTRVIAPTSRNQPIEIRKYIIKTVEKPFISRQQHKVETLTSTYSNNSEREALQTKRKHLRRVVAASRTKSGETIKQIFTSNIEPTIKISERPVETSSFTQNTTKTETFNSRIRGINGFKSTVQSTSKPTLITKDVFVEKPVQYSVENPTTKKLQQVIQSETESNSSSRTSSGSHSQANRLHGGRDPIVPIIEQENRVFSQHGAFSYRYEAGDGTRAFSTGKLKEVSKDHAGEAVEGGYSYTDKDGNDFSISYTADENGFRPVGAHLPTPPPIPIAIARALAYLATKSTPEPVTEPTRKH